MDYLRRSARVSRLEHISNQEIRTRMNAGESIIYRIKNKGLSWFGHVLRIKEENGQNNFISGSHQGKGNEEDQKSHGGKKW
jgi:hypothetical protein